MSSIWLGPLAIVITWIAFLFVYFNTSREGHTTLSSVAAANKWNYWVFCIGLIASGLLIFVFIRDWLMPALQLPRIFLYITGVATLVCQPIIAIVPIGTKWQSAIHNGAAYIEWPLFPIMALMIAQSNVLPAVIRVVCWGLIGFMVYLAVEFRKNFLKPKFLHIQGLFIASFHTMLLLATFSA